MCHTVFFVCWCCYCCYSVGMLVLDPVSAPKWRLDCSRCSFLIYLPKDLHDARVSKERCEVRGGGWLNACSNSRYVGFLWVWLVLPTS